MFDQQISREKELQIEVICEFNKERSYEIKEMEDGKKSVFN